MKLTSQESGKVETPAGAHAQMFRIPNEDTTFNGWEQALTVLLQYEFKFKCPKQAEWQLFGGGTGVLQGPPWAGGGAGAEKALVGMF